MGKFDRLNSHAGVRLVKGSHIVTKKLYEGDHAYIFQSADGRVIFVMPYEGDYTLIGTTEAGFDLDNDKEEISGTEIDYLCAAANEYFERKPFRPMTSYGPMPVCARSMTIRHRRRAS